MIDLYIVLVLGVQHIDLMYLYLIANGYYNELS